MCGRQSVGPAAMAETSRYSGGKHVPSDCKESPNFCPSQQSALIVKKESNESNTQYTNENNEKDIITAKWGLMPSWMLKEQKDQKGSKAPHPFNNARAGECLSVCVCMLICMSICVCMYEYMCVTWPHMQVSVCL